MRILLMTIMLLIVIIAVYESTIGGEAGAQREIERRADRVHTQIDSIQP